MVSGNDSNLAQAIYLAQMYAARRTCKCKACQLLRKVADDMTDQMLGSATTPRGKKKDTKVLTDIMTLATQEGESPEEG